MVWSPPAWASQDKGNPSLCILQVVPGHRVCQRGRPHGPHAEAEEAARGARQVGAAGAGMGVGGGTLDYPATPAPHAK